ncbi:MAG: DUF2892 domain-containing protein [Candidatus Altiarchaeota archaeon]
MKISELLWAENVGGFDLMLRTLVGVLSIIILAMDLVSYPWDWVFAVLAFGGLYTAIMRHCSPYSVIGFSTKKKNCN